MQYLDFIVDNSESRLKFLKSSIMIQRCVTYLNIIISFFQGNFLYLNIGSTSNNIVTSICLGVSIGNSIWCLSHLSLLKQDLKLEKKRLSILKRRHNNEELKNLEKQLNKQNLIKTNDTDHENNMP